MYQTQENSKLKHSNFNKTNTYLVLQKITYKLPVSTLNVKNFCNYSNIESSDPSYNQPGFIDLFVGANLFWNLVYI